MEILTIENVECELAFVLIGCGARKSKWIKSYGRLKKRESDENCCVITKISMLQKDNRNIFYTYKFIMKIPIVGNVERKKAFILIGYDSRNS